MKVRQIIVGHKLPPARDMRPGERIEIVLGVTLLAIVFTSAVGFFFSVAYLVALILGHA